jgi:hypothetical protein
MKKVLGVVGVLGVVSSCAIPNTSDIELADCIRTCDQEVEGCLNGVGAEDPCFKNLEMCFDAASACSKGCRGCVDNHTCLSEDLCQDGCNDQANQCTDLIDYCVNGMVTKAKDELKSSCLDPLVDCVADCIEEVENALK